MDDGTPGTADPPTPPPDGSSGPDHPPDSGPGPKPQPSRSHVGRLAAVAIAVASAAGIGTGLNNAGQGAGASGASCGGTERWDVKVANDQSASNIDANPKADTIADLNTLTPGPVDSGGRMDVEKTEYTITGYIAFFKPEGDGDYHVVITDGLGGYAAGRDPGTGHSVVVELPDPNCFAGKSGAGANTSRFAQAIADARSQFEDKTSGQDGTNLAAKIPVTVTGVAFFDFYHGQTGHAVVRPGVDGQPKVIELHPVTNIEFADGAQTD